MDKEHVKGAGNKAAGSIKEEVGKALKDPSLEAKGKFQKAKGEAQDALGDAKDAFKN